MAPELADERPGCPDVDDEAIDSASTTRIPRLRGIHLDVRTRHRRRSSQRCWYGLSVWRTGVPMSSPRYVLVVAVGLTACAPKVAPKEPFSTRAPGPDFPLVGDEGLDPWGGPRQAIDQRVVRKLLLGRHFDELTKLLEEAQAYSVAHCTHERWVLDAFNAATKGGGGAEATVYDEWVKAKPGSWVSVLVQGLHWSEVARRARGGAWASKTSAQQFEDQRRFQLVAVERLNESISLHPTMLAHVELMRIARTGSGDEAQVELHRMAAMADCPGSNVVWGTYLFGLRPRWGGSYEAMAAAAAAAPVSANPKLVTLSGYAAADRCELLRHKKSLGEALEACDAALSTGRLHDFLREKADVLIALERPEEALSLAEEAVRLGFHQDSRILTTLATALAMTDRVREATESLSLADEIDPSRVWTQPLDVWLVLRLAAHAQLELQRGAVLEAEADITEALRRVPNYAPGYLTKGKVLRAKGDLPGAITAWETYASSSAGAPYYTEDLSAAYLSTGQAEKAVAMWTRHIAAAGGKALSKAWTGRAKALFALGRSAEARADLAQACERGDVSSCPASP